MLSLPRRTARPAVALLGLLALTASAGCRADGPASAAPAQVSDRAQPTGQPKAAAPLSRLLPVSIASLARSLA